MAPAPDSLLLSRPKRRERVLARATGDTVVLLDTDSGGYYSLEDVGASIWSLCDGELTVAEIVQRISDEYEAAAETVQADVIAFVGDLAGERLLVL